MMVEAPKYGASSRTAAISAPSDPIPTTKTSTVRGGISASDCRRPYPERRASDLDAACMTKVAATATAGATDASGSGGSRQAYTTVASHAQTHAASRTRRIWLTTSIGSGTVERRDIRHARVPSRRGTSVPAMTLASDDRTYLWHPFTQQRGWQDEDAPVIERGDGAYLWDPEGRRYIDGVSSLWCNVHGHRHPAIDIAIRDQLDKVAHSTMLGLTHEPAIELAKR